MPPPGWGLRGIDGLLGAFPPGRLSEIVGPWSSGGSSLLLALIARVTTSGGRAAVVDGTDAFDPASASAAGADLSGLLWVKCGGRLDPAPLALLDLAGDTAARFERWGIRTLGELAALPAPALFERPGSEGIRLQRLARGEDLRPLDAWAPPPVFEESAPCEWGLETLACLGRLHERDGSDPPVTAQALGRALLMPV